MKQYDPALPLFMIHIPKTGGASVLECVKDWFGDGLLLHYYDAVNGKMPEKYDLARVHSRETPVMLYGHFNKKRHFGIPDYYPEASQFITILRDPFERMISGYYFLRRVGVAWKDKSLIPQTDIGEFLLQYPIRHGAPFSSGSHNGKLPGGDREQLHRDRHYRAPRRIAAKLGKPYDSKTLKHLNISKRDENVPYELKAEFMAKNPLAYAVHNYALSKYE